MGKEKMLMSPWLADGDDAGSFSIPIMISNDSLEESEQQVPDELPLLPLLDNTLFPGTLISISVTRKKSVRLLREMSKSNGIFAVASQKSNDPAKADFDDLQKIGTTAKVVKMLDMPDGSKMALLQGRTRINILELVSEEPYKIAKVSVRPDLEMSASEAKEFKASCSLVRDTMKRIISGMPNVPNEAMIAIGNMPDRQLVNMLSSSTDIDNAKKQRLLEIDSPLKKANQLAEYLGEQLKFIELKNEIKSKTDRDLNQQQREYILHQQLKTIQNELGNGSDAKIEELRKKAKDKKWPATAKEAFEKELEKLARLNPNAAEYSLQTDYVETILELPWNKYSKDNFNIARAAKRLDADHYGLDNVKERILEHLAVLQLKGDMKSPIICLYGPPGVGKTSLGKSIAESLNRKYVRVSLGGMHDEAEIRGHRRTYIGSMMGRVMQGIKKAGTSNPVFILDEVDKLSRDGHGDPESALLEVLDPEQNNAFHDNYLDIDYDLSKVLFIATANDVGSISQPLRDRMEMINVSGYVAEEKLEIGKHHLLPKEMENHGIEKNAFSISKKGFTYLIDNYTRESGVRQLDKMIASICRKMALKIAKNEEVAKTIGPSEIREMLGIEKVHHDEWEEDMKPGVVTGLAWTAVGGEILFVESSISKGKGKLTLTGNLGDVMKESAILALDYIRCNVSQWNLDDVNFDEVDFHIHVPEGATPKDGPSAGITIATSIVSALTGRKVRKRVAMTGEITLRGSVLPVGGIKEKILAAKRAGIEDIILSEKNSRDIEEINEMYLHGLTFHYVKKVSEVIDFALERK
ncbi:MAG: endopeptidase La [Bacteroidales bacterium]|nr:endopeptidase La [Bacteroidales bacterium]